ncbi:fibroblast growth factor 18-like protein [Labeo rohita]|uniref:Fibroblast growth factor 18-like protein n=1 Tax=Labeo rohita TaxID=84645 RepID=A0A498N1M2_LABRO|nr:fibroblast growth factor 18-like protein [Labeo rohita]
MWAFLSTVAVLYIQMMLVMCNPLQKASNRSADCVFIEKVLENNYTALMSARYTGWYVGFTKRGRPRRGPHTLPNQQDVHFMKRFPPGEQPDLTPFRFTTVSKRSKKVRAARPR